MTAAEWEAYALDPLRNQKHREAAAAGELADWLSWLELGGSAPRTLESYEWTAAALLRMFPTLRFGEFTDSELMRFLMLAPEKSRRVRKAHLGSWFRWGFRTRKITANPMDLLPTIKRPHQDIIEIFPATDEAILRALPSPDGHLMTLLFEAGLRKAEACNITGRRIDLDRRVVIVKEGAKGSRDRVVPMVPELQHAMANLMLLEGIGRDDFLWYDRPGSPVTRKVRRSQPIAATSFGRWWARCIEDAGVEYRKPHTTRHTFATRWRERGLDLDELQILLGHASVSTTSDLYVHTKVNQVGDRMRELMLETVTL